MAIGLGALAASEQFGDNTVQFLYTKPRTRAYFVWVNWALGFAELSVAVLVNLLVGWFVLVRYLKNPVRINFWELLDKQAIVGELIYCLLLYCLTYSLTAILRKGMHGLGATIISVSFLQAVAIILRTRWQIHAPIPPEPIATLSPFVSKILWTVLALLFIIGAQYRVERAEL